jgi:chitinase
VGLDNRDGSYLEFLARGNKIEPGTDQTYVAHILCMKEDEAFSNLDDMHEGRLEGAILKMPEEVGFAKYAVAHTLHETNYTLPAHAMKRAPQGGRNCELSYSYDFAKVQKRGSGGDIYFRVDYASSNKYYTDIVEAKHQERDLQSRFWSKRRSVPYGSPFWTAFGARIATTMTLLTSSSERTTLPRFIRKTSPCLLSVKTAGKGRNRSGFLKLGIPGTMKNKTDFGFTLIGKIQPYKLDEAYVYVITDMLISAQLDLDGRGELDMSTGPEKKLLGSPITLRVVERFQVI